MPPKGFKKTSVKKEVVPPVIQETVEPKQQEIAACDTCRYHITELPKIFKAGSVIPEGWTRDNRRHWIVTDNGEYKRVNS
jgi:hypothetical protein